VYHGQFQNQDPNRRALTATMVTITQIGTFAVIRSIARLELNPYEQKDVIFLTLRVNNPGGTGAPTAATVGQTVRFVCTFR